MYNFCYPLLAIEAGFAYSFKDDLAFFGGIEGVIRAAADIKAG